MPIYEYIATDETQACEHCRDGFEQLAAISDERLTVCPKCGHSVRRSISAAAVGHSQSGLDDRAKNAGFHKLKKISHGEYERQY